MESCKRGNSVDSSAMNAILDYVDFRQQQFLRMLSRSMNSIILGVGASSLFKRSDTPNSCSSRPQIISLIYSCTAPLSGIFTVRFFLPSHLVVSITRRHDVAALCSVIQAGALHMLITLDLQCIHPLSSHQQTADSPTPTSVCCATRSAPATAPASRSSV